MYTRDTGQSELPEGLYVIQAEFYTEHLVVRGEVTVVETRLSDHLNGTATSVEIQPLHVEQMGTGRHMDLPGSHAHLTKAHMLFILPLDEPAKPESTTKAAWEWKMLRQCWAAVGRYNILGKIHAEAGRDPKLILRSLEQKRFLPLTEATITFPDGTTREHGTIIVNRHHLEVVALLSAY